MYLDPRRVDNPKTIRKISWKNGFDRWFEKETTFRIFSVKNPWEPNSGTNFALAPCIVLTVFRKKFKMSKKIICEKADECCHVDDPEFILYIDF